MLEAKKLSQLYFYFCDSTSNLKMKGLAIAFVLLSALSSLSSSDDLLQRLAELDKQINKISKKVENLQFSVMPQCQPEKFTHDYILMDNSTKAHSNQWRAVYATQNATLRDLCISADGVSPVRRCLRRNKTAEWEPIDKWPRVQCFSGNASETARLNQILNTIIETPEAIKNATERHEFVHEVRAILEDPNVKKTPTNLDITTKILTRLTNDTADAAMAPDILGIYKAFHETPRRVLRISSINHNATNEFLSTVDSYMKRLTAANLTAVIKTFNETSDHSNSTLNYPHLCVRAMLSAALSTFLINPDCENVSGISIYEASVENRAGHVDGEFGIFSYRFVRSNESAEALLSEAGIEAAAFLPEALWQHVKAKANRTELWIVIEVHVDDHLFLDNSYFLTARPRSKVISISIPGFEGELQPPMPFVLRNVEYRSCAAKPVVPGTGCGYWNYSTWVSNGVKTATLGPFQQQVILCETSHLTDFSYLAHGSFEQTDYGEIFDISENHQTALDTISLVGCSLSLIGMLGIWATAAISPAWRSAAKTKLLLHVCVALTLQMLLFISMNMHEMWEHFFEKSPCIKCIALGAIMQYITLSLFCWMLIVAHFQYKRYVQVFRSLDSPRHFIRKSALAAWGCPLVPTALVVYIDPNTYTTKIWEFVSGDGMCYPSGYSLIYGVLVPISLICLTNLCIFVYIFYSMSQTLSKPAKQDKSLIMNQVRLSILLFFLLGLSWIFGIITFFRIGIVFSYLFCLTATLQGFIIFLFFVLLQKEPREAWRKLFTSTHSSQRRKKNSDTQTMLSASSAEFLSQKRNLKNSY